MLVHTRQLVQYSYATLSLQTDHAAMIFYRELFALEPGLRILFRGNLLEQGRTLMQTIGACVRLLEQPERLAPMLQELGQRHTAFGVAVRDYDSFGLALIRTLEVALGPAFNNEVRAAWIHFYRKLASGMLQAAQGRGENVAA
jgi:hemoglobin-like flavoprotein